MDSLSTRELDRFHAHMAREAAKPKAVRDLEHQLHRIQARKQLAILRQIGECEADSLRRRIRDMGETPCA